MPEPSPTTGITPSLSELVGLRALVLDRGVARRGWHGQSGQSASPLRGRGMEYAESREYADGDDVRHVDWRLTARTGRTHTKLFQPERERLSLVVADTAATLYFGTRQRFKSVQAARAGAVAAWRAVRDGDRIAALRGSHRDPPVTPAVGPRGALRVLDALVRWYTAPPDEDAGLSVALDHAQRLLRPGSRLLVLADPASIESVPSRRWAALALHNAVTVLLLTDPLEQHPPARRLPFTVGSDEPSARVEIDLADEAHRRRWAEHFRAPLLAALERLPALGIEVQELASDAPSDGWLPGRGVRAA
ncbi:MAG: DUF58 domain-containing protein [Pseudoxanthomonas suwonensis]|nr:DUF58 domain-containing protein [Pseudoxanthomonas suwonensis]